MHLKWTLSVGRFHKFQCFNVMVDPGFGEGWALMFDGRREGTSPKGTLRPRSSASI